MRPEWPQAALAGVRGLIDGVDDGLVLLFAGRRRLVALAAGLKRASGGLARDRHREAAVRRRAGRIGRRLGVPPASSERLMHVLIADACQQQGLPASAAIAGPADPGQGTALAATAMLAAPMQAFPSPPTRWLRLLPPPHRLAPLLRRIPPAWQARVLEPLVRQALARPLADGLLAPLAGRRIGIDVEDLGLHWVFCLQDGQMRLCPPEQAAEATVRGAATDLALLASRQEDADTLFFQRRLVLTGDTELGLLARNLLDQLPWQDVPLGLRILMHRGAGLLSSARAAYHQTAD